MSSVRHGEWQHAPAGLALLSPPRLGFLKEALLALWIGWWLLGGTAHAAPVFPEVVTLRQPNGMSFQALPFGDEWANGLRTLSGHLITYDKLTGQWVYARPRADGRVDPTGRIVGRDQPPLESLRPLSRQKPHERKDQPPRRSSALSPPRSSGTQPLLGILVEFDDQPPVGTTSEEWWEKLFGASASARDYYLEVSWGHLSLEPAQESHGTPNDGIVGWLRLAQPHPNTQGSVTEANRELVRTALQAADEFVDFAAFDLNGDGALSSDELHIVIIVAGYDASYGGAASCTPSVWAHQAGVGQNPPTLDGVRLGDLSGGGGYVQLGEWHCSQNDSPGHPATLGVLVHELGHDIGRGAPDLYDSDGSSYGIGNWDVMATGAWNMLDTPGDTPAHPSAWVKAFFGWVSPQVLRSGEQALSLEARQIVQVLDNPGGIEWDWGDPAVGEYFLLEHRAQTGYDAALPAEGLLIWYIDESQFNNDDETRRLVDLLEADGQNNLKCRGQPQCNKGDRGDPFPGATSNQAFTKDTTPSSNFRNGYPSGVELTSIRANGATVAAQLRVGAVNTGNLVLFADAFEGPSDGWWASGPWALQPATQCQSGSPLASGNVWYHGAAQDCQYDQGGSLLSPTIAIPPGTIYARLKFSTLIKTRRGDRAEVLVYFNNNERARVVYRRSATRGWIAVARRIRVPAGVSEMYLEFVVRQGRGRRSPTAQASGWWIDNIEVRTEASRTRRSDGVSPAPSHQERSSPIEARVRPDGTLQIATRQPAQAIQLSVYDLAGRLVATAAATGSALIYSGHDERGQSLPNGVYLYIVTVQGFDGAVIRSEVRKLIVR